MDAKFAELKNADRAGAEQRRRTDGVDLGMGTELSHNPRVVSRRRCAAVADWGKCAIRRA